VYSFLSRWKTVQPQVRLNLSIFNRPRPVFVNLNSHVFFVPWPTSPKSKTVFSKEIRGKRLSAAKANLCMLIDNERKRCVKTNSIKSLFRHISHFTSSYSYNSSVWYYWGQQGLFSQFFFLKTASDPFNYLLPKRKLSYSFTCF